MDDNMTKDYKQHWIARQWPSMFKMGKMAMLPEEHFLPSRSKKLEPSVMTDNRRSSNSYAVSTPALLNTLAYWSTALKAAAACRELLEALLGRFFNGHSFPFMFNAFLMSDALPVGGQNVSKLDHVHDRSFKIHNGIAMVSEIRQCMPKAKEVLQGLGHCKL